MTLPGHICIKEIYYNVAVRQIVLYYGYRVCFFWKKISAVYSSPIAMQLQEKFKLNEG